MTQNIVERLPTLLDKLGTEVLVDVGCGDFTWMQRVRLDLAYVGVDVVPEVISRNRAEFSGPGRTFHLLDATREALPAGDTVLCREVLFHLSFGDIQRLLAGAFSVPRRYLVATTDRITMVNANIRSGDYRVLDLERRPFRLGPPSFELDDGALIGGRRLGVWPAERVREALGLPDVDDPQPSSTHEESSS